MLVISRRKGERILVGDVIEIVVLELGRGGVRLGITAPHDVTVHRAAGGEIEPVQAEPSPPGKT